MSIIGAGGGGGVSSDCLLPRRFPHPVVLSILTGRCSHVPSLRAVASTCHGCNLGTHSTVEGHPGSPTTHGTSVTFEDCSQRTFY